MVVVGHMGLVGGVCLGCYLKQRFVGNVCVVGLFCGSQRFEEMEWWCGLGEYICW